MSDDREERIRMRAHEIWEREGRPVGREAEHWEQAGRELEVEAADSVTAPGEGISSSLQPGGTALGGSPGVTQGSIGTGGGSTRGGSSGNAKRMKP